MTEVPAAAAQPAPQRTRRVFFAFWPDAGMRASLTHATHKAARACGGRPVPVHNLHVTLLFLGSIPESRIPGLVTIADRVAHDSSPVHLVFDRIEFWEKAHVLVATPSAPPAVATRLAEILLQETLREGFAPDLKAPFRPHVTLARKVQHPPRFVTMAPVPWRCTGFVLMESRTLAEGPVYTVLHEIPLGR